MTTSPALTCGLLAASGMVVRTHSAATRFDSSAPSRSSHTVTLTPPSGVLTR